jgi:hypothetical protein
MTIGDYVKYSSGRWLTTAVGVICRSYISHDGEYKGKEVLVVQWIDGWTTHTLETALVPVLNKLNDALENANDEHLAPPRRERT